VDLREIVLTHAHRDHAGSAAALAAATGARVLAGAADADAVRGLAAVPPARVDRELADGDRLEWGGEGAGVLHVPGHTPGSIALYLPSAGRGSRCGRRRSRADGSRV
jgi:glyoxylase-like metal-dependent hydrolase (beta-lactamase superfamily II)